MSICNYEIHIRGDKQRALMFCATIRDLHKSIVSERETNRGYILWISGQCADECDLYGKEEDQIVINHNLLTEEEIRTGVCADEFFNLSLRQKSESLGVEILVRVWSKENDYDQIEHYRNGYFVGIIGDIYREKSELEFDF